MLISESQSTKSVESQALRTSVANLDNDEPPWSIPRERMKRRTRNEGRASPAASAKAKTPVPAVTVSTQVGGRPGFLPAAWLHSLSKLVERRGAWIIVGLALLVRLVHWWSVRASDPLYAHTLPETDMHTYWEWAKTIAAGDWLSRKQGVFYYGPLYPYWLAFWFKLFGPNYDVTHLLQVCVGVIAPLAIWDLTRRLFGPREAMVAGLLVALAAPILFYEQLLLMEGLLVGIHAGFLWCCIRAIRAEGRIPWRWALAAGFLAGLACLGRGNFQLVALAFIPTWYVAIRLRCAGVPPDTIKPTGECTPRSRAPLLGQSVAENKNKGEQDRLATCATGSPAVAPSGGQPNPGEYSTPHLWDVAQDRKAAWWAAFAYAAALCLVLGLSLARNGLVGGKWVLTTSNGPILLYIGNAPDAMGIFHYPDSFFALETKYGGDRGAVPWTRELIAATIANPWRFLTNLARKTVLFFNAYEIADNANYYLLGRFSPVVRYNPVGWQLIVALGVVGAWLTRRRWREQIVLYIYAATFAASIIAVFIVGRYRLEFLLPMAVWAGAAAMWLLEAMAARTWRRVYLPAAAVLVLIVLLDLRWSPAVAWNSPPNMPGVRPIRPNDFTLLARAHLDAKQVDKVKQTLGEGFAQHPWDQTLAKNLALMLESEGRFGPAAEVLRRYLSLMPGDFDMACELARILARSGNTAEAKKIVEKILEIEPSHQGARRLQEQLQP